MQAQQQNNDSYGGFEVRSGDTVFLYNSKHNLWTTNPTLQNVEIEGTTLTRSFPVITSDPQRAVLLRISSADANAFTKVLTTDDNIYLQFIQADSQNQFAGVLGDSQSAQTGRAQVVLFQINTIPGTTWSMIPLANAKNNTAPRSQPLLYGTNYTFKNHLYNLFLGRGYQINDTDFTYGLNNLVTATTPNLDMHIDEWQIVPSKILYHVQEDGVSCLCDESSNDNNSRGLNTVLEGFSCGYEPSTTGNNNNSDNNYVCRSRNGDKVSFFCKGNCTFGASKTTPKISLISLKRDSRLHVVFFCLIVLVCIVICAFSFYQRTCC